MKYLILRKSNAFPQNIYIFVFLVNLQTSKYVMPAFTLLKIRSYFFDCFFRSLGSTKKEFVHISEPIIRKICNSF